MAGGDRKAVLTGNHAVRRRPRQDRVGRRVHCTIQERDSEAMTDTRVPARGAAETPSHGPAWSPEIGRRLAASETISGSRGTVTITSASARPSSTATRVHLQGG